MSILASFFEKYDSENMKYDSDNDWLVLRIHPNSLFFDRRLSSPPPPSLGNRLPQLAGMRIPHLHPCTLYAPGPVYNPDLLHTSFGFFLSEKNHLFPDFSRC